MTEYKPHTERDVKVLDTISNLLDVENLNVYDLLSHKLGMRDGGMNIWHRDNHHGRYTLTELGFKPDNN